MIRLVRDYETRNDVSVVEAGSRRYAADPSLELLCVSFRVRNGAGWGRPQVAIGVGGSDGRAAIERRVRERDVDVVSLDDYRNAYHQADVCVAHNVGFERAVEDWLFPELAALRKPQSCTAARARRLSLPGALDDACKVLHTPNQKSLDGHRTMLMVSQPRPTYTAQGVGNKWFDDADRLAETALYCAGDILAESDLDDYLPELTPFEQAIWEQIERVNQRGMRLDLELIAAMEWAIEQDYARVMFDVARYTNDPDFPLTNPERIRTFCKSRGVWMEDLRAETVRATLERDIDPAARSILLARQQVGGKSSTSKIPRMKARLLADERVRDSTIYHGAHTGRTTGDGINTLNLPRPYRGFDQDVVIDCLLRHDLKDLHEKQQVYASAAVSAALRGVIIPDSGKKFVIADYSSVEPCFSFTFARQWDAVEILRRKESLYIEFGLSIYNRKLDKIADLKEYTICKETVLGCGYGLGATRFNSYLAGKGVVLSEAETDPIHNAYRRRFPQIPRSWYGLETAAKAALEHPGQAYDYNGVQFYFDGWWLTMKLPSGRIMYYPNARLLDGRFNKEIVYEGRMRVEGRPAGWGDIRTWGGSILENLTQAACRDIMEEDELRIEAVPGYEVKLTVYDEIVTEVPIDDATAVNRIKEIMCRPREWMLEMPVSAEVFEAMRYVKH